MHILLQIKVKKLVICVNQKYFKGPRRGKKGKGEITVQMVLLGKYIPYIIPSSL